MERSEKLSLRLLPEEREWLRRMAYWEGISTAELLRRQIALLVCDAGYLRPPDDEPQDFGYEKEMMQFVERVKAEYAE